MSGARSKSDRLLYLYSHLLNGETLTKHNLAQQFDVTERSIQRDMEALRCFFADENLDLSIIYDYTLRGYRLENHTAGLNNSEILAVCKILLESRSMRRDEMLPILDKLIACCVPEESKRSVTELIANEKYHYIEPHHSQPILEGLWEIGQAVQQHRVMTIEYKKLKGNEIVQRTIEPVGIMFSEYYFYLTAFLRQSDKPASFYTENGLPPTIYRIDRIKNFQVLDERFHVPYSNRFEEGEFRKRVQLMLRR